MKPRVTFAALMQFALLLPGQDYAIRGRVNGQDGKPAANVRVAVAEVDEQGKIPAEMVLARVGKTDELGSYRLDGIPPGTYAIIAGVVERPTYYPGTATREQARIVTLDRDSDSLAFDFNLVTPTSLPRRNGLRSFSGIPVQDVLARLVVEGFETPPLLSETFVLSFAGSPGKIKVEVTLDQTSSAFRVNEASDPSGTVSLKTGVPVRSDGLFYLSLPEEDYKVTATRIKGSSSRVGSGYYIKSVQFGSSDLLRAVMRFKAPVTSDVVVTVAPCTAETLPLCN
jgi:Carboxypeptidase regulatory-like domain